MELDGVDVAVDHLPTAVDPELLEQEVDLASLGLQDLVLRVELPQLPLERTKGLLARRVDELLVGLAILPLVGGVGHAPALDLGAQRRREGGMVIEQVLETGREVDLGRLGFGEAME